MEEAVSERRKALAAAHISDEDRQALISASRRASSVIAKAEAWQTTCSSLSPKSNPKSVHSLLRSIAGSSSSSSFSPNFSNCFSPREPASVYAAYLRSHFSVSQPKALRSRARGYLSELRRASCPVESHYFFRSPFTLIEFLAAASNFSSSTATGPHLELCFDWSAGLSTGVFLSIRANARPASSQSIPTKLASSPTSSYSALTSVSTPLQLFLGLPSTALFPVLNMCPR